MKMTFFPLLLIIGFYGNNYAMNNNPKKRKTESELTVAGPKNVRRRRMVASDFFGPTIFEMPAPNKELEPGEINETLYRNKQEIISALKEKKEA